MFSLQGTPLLIARILYSLQGFPCDNYYTGRILFSLQGTLLLIAGILYSLQGFPCENYYTGMSLLSLQGMGLQWEGRDGCALLIRPSRIPHRISKNIFVWGSKKIFEWSRNTIKIIPWSILGQSISSETIFETEYFLILLLEVSQQI